VALSLELLPAGVTRRRIRVEPGLSSNAPFPACARGRPTDWRGQYRSAGRRRNFEAVWARGDFLRALAALTGAVVLVWSGAAATQVVSPITDSCTADSAFDEQFGATAVNGRPPNPGLVLNAEHVEIAPSFAPFTEAEVVFSQTSDRVHRVTGFAEYANEAEADAAYAAAVRAFAADHAFSRSPRATRRRAGFRTRSRTR